MTDKTNSEKAAKELTMPPRGYQLQAAYFLYPQGTSSAFLRLRKHIER